MENNALFQIKAEVPLVIPVIVVWEDTFSPKTIRWRNTSPAEQDFVLVLNQATYYLKQNLATQTVT